MTADSWKSLIIKILLMILTPLAAQLHLSMGPTDLTAIAADLADLAVLAYGVYRSSGMKLVPHASVAIGKPAEVVTNMIKGDQATVTGKIVGALLVAMALALLALPQGAMAQALRKPQITGNVVEDTKANLGIGSSSGSVLTGNPSKDLIALYTKLQAVSLVDLKYAQNIATKKSNKAAGQCWSAIITQIEQDQQANLGADGNPLPTPDPHLFTDVERLSDMINSLGPNSDLMVGCGSFANQAKMNVVTLISTILAGGAGIAALAP